MTLTGKIVGLGVGGLLLLGALTTGVSIIALKNRGRDEIQSTSKLLMESKKTQL